MFKCLENGQYQINCCNQIVQNDWINSNNSNVLKK